MILRNLLALLLASLGVLSACQRLAPDVLATYREGSLRLADLDTYVRALPEAKRIAPSETSREAWLEELLSALALERILEANETVLDQLASSENQTRRRWMIASHLADRVMQDLAGGIALDEDAIREHLAETEHGPRPRYDFRHVFFRLDRAEDQAERQSVRRLATSITERARAGEDFAALASEHSQSKTAADGGLVENHRPERLDETTRQALAALAEGDVSPVVESRTGLHIFKLERRLHPQPPGQEQRERRARNALARQQLLAARDALLSELRGGISVTNETFPWRVGSFEVTQADLEGWSAEGDSEATRQAAVEQLLLAEAGRQRGLLTPELEARVDRLLRHEAIQSAYQEHRAERVATTPLENLRSLYDARPTAFAAPETAHLEMIFVSQGRDVFATQRRMEDHVTKLRDGASFAELAQRLSTGPNADQGGDLGWLPPSEWVRLGPEIYKAVVELEPGAISVPIYQTNRILTADQRTLRGGFVILRVAGKRPPQERTLEEAIDDLRAEYARRHAAEIDREVRAEILAEAGFEIARYPTPDELLL